MKGLSSSRLLPFLVALGGVAAATVPMRLVFELDDVSNISMVYLIPVLAVAIAYGRGPAIVASVAAFLTYDFFFIEPTYTFSVRDPEEWIALSLLLLTGVVAAELADSQRRRTTEAREREREAVVLYTVVRQLGDPDLQAAIDAVAQRLVKELDLAAAVIEFSREGPVVHLQRPAGSGESVAGAPGGRRTSPGATDGVGLARSEFWGVPTTPSGLDRTGAGAWFRLQTSPSPPPIAPCRGRFYYPD
ncbi:MAG: DUF4118 domain-containing protein [Dehalococcoidia bacterium]